LRFVSRVSQLLETVSVSAVPAGKDRALCRPPSEAAASIPRKLPQAISANR